MTLLSAQELAELALFPLPDIALFPRTLLPLHIFEPRYRALIADISTQGRPLAVVRLRPGYEADYEGRPPIFDICGVGRLVSTNRLPDGRYNIMLEGLARLRIEAELPPLRPYRLARGRILADDRSTRTDELNAAHGELVALCEALARIVPAETGAALRQLTRAVTSPGGCADVVASALVRDPDLRQQLLELLDPADRLAQVSEYVAKLVAQFRPGERTIN